MHAPRRRIRRASRLMVMHSVIVGGPIVDVHVVFAPKGFGRVRWKVRKICSDAVRSGDGGKFWRRSEDRFVPQLGSSQSNDAQYCKVE